MSYILESSLEKRTLVKIASTLWNQSDIRALISEKKTRVSLEYTLEHIFRRIEWKTIEEEVIKKVEKLPQPHLLKEKITRYIRLMGSEILKWMQYNSNTFPIFSEKNYLPSGEFSWTPYGTINSRETARLFIQDLAVHPVARYQLAFTYCFEGDIQVIWDSIPEDCKDLKSGRVSNPTVINEQNLADVWTSGNPDRCFWDFPEAGTGSYGASFLNAVKVNNKVAVAYFLQKLTPEEREECLTEAALDVYRPDAEVLCFLLSQMDEEQRKRVMQRNYRSIMERMLEWPWVRFYVETANCFWDVTDENHTLPLAILVSEVLKGRNEILGGMYRELFWELWQCACSRFGADVSAHPYLLSNLFEMKEKEIIRWIFGDASPALKEDFIWSRTGLDISIKLIEGEEWDLLDFFIQQCLTSEGEIMQYRNKFHLS